MGTGLDHGRSCREGQEPELSNPETETRTGPMATYPIGRSSTIDPNPSRPGLYHPLSRP